MATIKVLASGSSGNCYVLESGSERLIIECGVRFDDLALALDYSFDGVAGTITSHNHKDHINGRTAVKLWIMGAAVYGTAKSKEINPYIEELTDKTPVEIGGFTVMPLSVPHGECPNFAYVIDLPEDEGRLIFATDCQSFPYNIPDVNFMLVEANYDENIVRERLLDDNNIWNASETHMEIDTTLDVVKRHLTAELKQVILIHLSSAFSDERAFVEAVQALGVPCCAANKNMKIDLELYPF